MQPAGGLVEDVGDVRQRGTQVPDHPGALRLTTRQGSAGTVQRQITESDAHEGIEGFPQGGQQRGHGRLLDFPEPDCQVADLHRAGIRDGDAIDSGFAGLGGQPGALASGTDPEGDGVLHEGSDVGLHGLDVLAQEGFPDPRNQSLEDDVDTIHLCPGGFLVQQNIKFTLRVVS